ATTSTYGLRSWWQSSCDAGLPRRDTAPAVRLRLARSTGRRFARCPRRLGRTPRRPPLRRPVVGERSTGGVVGHHPGPPHRHDRTVVATPPRGCPGLSDGRTGDQEREAPRVDVEAAR